MKEERKEKRRELRNVVVFSCFIGVREEWSWTGIIITLEENKSQGE